MISIPDVWGCLQILHNNEVKERRDCGGRAAVFHVQPMLFERAPSNKTESCWKFTQPQGPYSTAGVDDLRTFAAVVNLVL